MQENSVKLRENIKCDPGLVLSHYECKSCCTSSELWSLLFSLVGLWFISSLKQIPVPATSNPYRWLLAWPQIFLSSALSFLMLCLKNSILSLSRPSALSPQIRELFTLQGSPSLYHILKTLSPIRKQQQCQESCRLYSLSQKWLIFIMQCLLSCTFLLSFLLSLGGRRYPFLFSIFAEKRSPSLNLPQGWIRWISGTGRKAWFC